MNTEDHPDHPFVPHWRTLGTPALPDGHCLDCGRSTRLFGTGLCSDCLTPIPGEPTSGVLVPEPGAVPAGTSAAADCGDNPSQPSRRAGEPPGAPGPERGASVEVPDARQAGPDEYPPRLAGLTYDASGVAVGLASRVEVESDAFGDWLAAGSPLGTDWRPQHLVPPPSPNTPVPGAASGMRELRERVERLEARREALELQTGTAIERLQKLDGVTHERVTRLDDYTNGLAEELSTLQRTVKQLAQARRLEVDPTALEERAAVVAHILDWVENREVTARAVRGLADAIERGEHLVKP